MRKGTKRYYGKMITDSAQSFIGKEVDIILKNGQSYHGVVKSVSDSAFQLTDGLAGKHDLLFINIDEIIKSIPAKY